MEVLRKRLASINPSCRKWHSGGRHGLQIKLSRILHLHLRRMRNCSCTMALRRCTCCMYMARARRPATRRYCRQGLHTCTTAHLKMPEAARRGTAKPSKARADGSEIYTLVQHLSCLSQDGHSRTILGRYRTWYRRLYGRSPLVLISFVWGYRAFNQQHHELSEGARATERL
jgi:hypothetical protein